MSHNDIKLATVKYNWTGYYIIMWERYARVHVYTGVKTILQVVIFLEFSLESLISALRNFKTEIFVLDYRFWIPNQCSNSHFVIQKFKSYPRTSKTGHIGRRASPNDKWNWNYEIGKSLGKDDSRDYEDFEWFLSRFKILFLMFLIVT